MSTLLWSVAKIPVDLRQIEVKHDLDSAHHVDLSFEYLLVDNDDVGTTRAVVTLLLRR